MQLVVEQIALPDKYSVPEDAIAARDVLLDECRGLVEIINTQGQAWVVAHGVDIQAHIKAVQQARKDLSAPLDDAKAKLIELEREYLAPLVAEKDRLSRMVSAYTLAERQRVAAAEAQRRAEFERLEKERFEAEQKAAKARSIEKQIQYEQQANNVMEAATAVLTEAPAVVSKAKGAAVRMDLKWEVTDEAALYAARPDLFTKPELKASAVLATCSKDTVLPGIRFFEVPKTSFRRTRFFDVRS